MARAERGGGAGPGREALTADATIVALSSGRPPAAIGIVRVSGPAALAAARRLAGVLPPPRRAALRALHDGAGRLLDRALVLVFPGPGSATGEDLVELHCHGGRAVVAAVEAALLATPGVRRAEPGEFTRRALLNGRIDLSQAQGLADLLEADTEAQRRRAMAAVEGVVGRAVAGWLARLTDLAALVEASIDYGDEGEVAAEAAALARVDDERRALAATMRAVLAVPPVERWREGWRVVIAGPPNAGKSTLLNLLGGREAAIVSAVAGTTRDRIEVPVVRRGTGYLLTDTAGLRDAADEVERLGIDRSRQAVAAADLVLWLGDEPPAHDAPVLWVHARADEAGRETMPEGRDGAVRRDRADSVEALWRLIEARLPEPAADELPLHRAERAACERALAALDADSDDAVLLAEQLRVARSALATILGIDATEQLLETVFARFCLGK